MIKPNAPTLLQMIHKTTIVSCWRHGDDEEDVALALLLMMDAQTKSTNKGEECVGRAPKHSANKPPFSLDAAQLNVSTRPAPPSWKSSINRLMMHLAPSTIKLHAAIHAWRSKSYHPSAGDMAELLLDEMMREWR